MSHGPLDCHACNKPTITKPVGHYCAECSQAREGRNKPLVTQSTTIGELAEICERFDLRDLRAFVGARRSMATVDHGSSPFDARKGVSEGGTPRSSADSLAQALDLALTMRPAKD